MFNPFKKQPVAPEEKFVSCETCKHLVREKDAKMVQELCGGWMTPRLKLYCPEHKPGYDEVLYSIGKRNYYKNIPAHQVKVTEEGKPVK